MVPQGAGQYQEGSKAVGAHTQRQGEVCSTAVVEGVHNFVVDHSLVVDHTLVVGVACSLLYSG